MKVVVLIATVLLLWSSSGGGVVAAVPPTALPSVFVARLTLDDAGNGWAWGLSADDSSTYQPPNLLIRIQNGGWSVAASTATNAALLPLDLIIKRMAITADGSEGWAIGSIGADMGWNGQPVIWHLYGGAWHIARNSFSKTLSLDDLTLSADGRNGWILTREEGPAPVRLLRLRNGHWDYVTALGIGNLTRLAISADGRQGWALRREDDGSLTVLRWSVGRWIPWYRHLRLNETRSPATLVVDNAGNAWLTTGIGGDVREDPDQLFHFSARQAPHEISLAATRPAGAAADALDMHGLALASAGSGWATGEWGYDTSAGEGRDLPLLLRLHGGMTTQVNPQRVGLPSGARLYQIAVSPHGGHSWVGWWDGAGVGHLSAIPAP